MHIFNLSSLFLATMEVGLSVVLICVLFVVGLAVGGLFGWLIYKKVTDKKLGTVEERTTKRVDDAAAECKALKKEAILEAKEQESKLRSDFERESREKRNELNKFEQRLQSREDNLDKKEDSLQKRSEQLEQQQKQKKKLRKLFRELGEVMDADGKSRRNYDYYGARFV